MLGAPAFMRIVPPNSTASGEEALAGPGEGAPNVAGNAVSSAAAVESEPQRTVTAAAADHNNLVGTVLADRYRLVRRIGEGGMGSVYQAEHITIGRKLAVKVLAPEFCDSPEVVARFLQEARTASMLHHEHIVDITDFGYTKQGLAFLTMEYLEGEDLATLLAREGRQPWTRVRRIVLQICRALDAAHEAGIIHRDMKPDNCFRIKRGGNPDFIKILDFGIAKVIEGKNPSRGDKPKMATEAGTLLGTPEYMAPEIARDQKPDARVDVYSLGVVMYELLTGTVPFKGQTFMATVAMQMVDEPEPPRKRAPDANIPEVIEKVVLRALAKDPAERYQTIRELADAIIEADRTLRYTQSLPALSWESTAYGVSDEEDSLGDPGPSTARSSQIVHTAPRANPTPRPPEAVAAPAPPAEVTVDDEPSNFIARPNPYRALTILLLLVVVGLGGFVYYLLNRPPEAPGELAQAGDPPGEPQPADDKPGDDADDDKKTDDKKSDDKKADDGKGGASKKSGKGDDHDHDRPHKKSGGSERLVASTDEERKEFFGAMAHDVRRCADQHNAAKELVRVAVNVEAGTGKLDAQLRSHKDNPQFAECIEKAFEKRRFKRGRQGFLYNSDYQI